jgi:hypothetical protein
MTCINRKENYIQTHAQIGHDELELNIQLTLHEYMKYELLACYIWLGSLLLFFLNFSIRIIHMKTCI